MHNGLLATLALASYFLAACNYTQTTPSTRPLPATTEEVAFATAVPIDEMNTFVTLRPAPEFMESTTVGSVLEFWVENQSDQWIVFSSDYGVMLFSFAQQADQWGPVEHSGHYVGTTELLLAPHGVMDTEKGLQWQLLAAAAPDIAAEAAPVVIRVVVVGHIYHDGNLGDPVAAYTDITIQP